MIELTYMKPKSYLERVTDRRMHSTRTLLLAALVLGLFLITGPLASAANIPLSFASTSSEGGGDEGGGNDNSDSDNGEEEGNGEGEGDETSEPEPEPEPTEPEPTPAPTEPAVPEQLPELAGDLTVTEPPEPIYCATGEQVANINDCPQPEPTPALPICDGTFQDCITPNGDICLAGQGGHECECAEDMSDCPLHPSLPPPLDPSPSPDPKKPLPYCDKVPDNYQGACHDRKDFDDITKLYPCNDGTQKEHWEECLDATSCKDYPKQYKCKPDDDEDRDEKKRHKDITIIINKIIKETNEGKHHDGFPDVDIIGLSVKQSGDAMICAMDIDDSHIQCQEFGMEPQRINQAFWRVIETDSDKNYDNGNTGSSDIDDAIEDIKSQDFDELEDADNHDFGIDLAFVAINPQGEGVTCLNTDQSGKGKSLCEPFKVSAQDVDGQITEGVEFS
jgi:hypothetical protein